MQRLRLRELSEGSTQADCPEVHQLLHKKQFVVAIDVRIILTRPQTISITIYTRKACLSELYISHALNNVRFERLRIARRKGQIMSHVNECESRP